MKKSELEKELNKSKEKYNEADRKYWELYDKTLDVVDYLRGLKGMDAELNKEDYKRIFNHFEQNEYRD